MYGILLRTGNFHFYLYIFQSSTTEKMFKDAVWTVILNKEWHHERRIFSVEVSFIINERCLIRKSADFKQISNNLSYFYCLCLGYAFIKHSNIISSKKVHLWHEKILFVITICVAGVLSCAGRNKEPWTNDWGGILWHNQRNSHGNAGNHSHICNYSHAMETMNRWLHKGNAKAYQLKINNSFYALQDMFSSSRVA